MGEIPPLNQFFFDRIWLKAYPVWFTDWRYNQLSRERIREYREVGAFKAWTDYAFKTYRTLNCVKIALRRGYDVADLRPRRCVEVFRYGDEEDRGDVWDFEVDVDSREVVVDVGGNYYRWGFDAVLTLDIIPYMVPDKRGRLVKDKMIYIAYKPWLRVGIRPYYGNFTPHMVRLFYNAVLRAKEELGIETPKEEWVSWHDNWIPPERLTSDVIRRNHEVAFDPKLKDIAQEEWRKWFVEDVDLAVRVSFVELSCDVAVPKEHLVWAFSGIGGISKTLKSGGVDLKYLPTEAGVKYYVTIKRGLQAKLYTKAVNLKTGLMLNRIEYTVKFQGVESTLGLIRPVDVYKRVQEVHL